MQIKWFKVAALLGALAIISGAFGAHALKNMLTSSASLETYNTAVLYHFLHSLFLISISFSPFHEKQVIHRIGILTLGGIVCFSGSLYLLAVLKWDWIGPVTPLGGVLLIAAWVYAALKANAS